jgi:hypothetical protein
MERLAFYRPAIVMTQEMQGEEYETFSHSLSMIAGKTFYLESEPESTSQPALF